MFRKTTILAAFAASAMLAAASGSTTPGTTAGTESPNAGSVASALPNTVGVSLNQPRGARGDTVNWRVRFTANGQPVSNMPVAFFWRSDSQGLTPIATDRTGSRGIAGTSFRIPRNPGQDNVVLVAVTGGGPFTEVVEQRIAIAPR